MFATLFILFNAIAMQQTDAHRVSHFVSSPHILPDTAVFDDSIKCMTATTYYVLSLLSIVPISFFISFFITSQLYRQNLLAIIGARFRPNEEEQEDTESESEQETEPEPTPDEKYITLYPIKRASNDPPKCLDELKYSIIVEGTPRGILVMCYNIDTEGFEYWSDSDIPLTMLETAARRYVTEYNCKSFYLPRKKVNVIDKEDEVVEEEEQPVEVEQEQEHPVVEEEESVFIKRKKTDAQVKLEKQIAEEEPVTRFIKRGKLLDFKPKDLFKGMNFEEQMVKKTLDYGTFQKAMLESMDPTTSRQDYASIRDAFDAKS